MGAILRTNQKVSTKFWQDMMFTPSLREAVALGRKEPRHFGDDSPYSSVISSVVPVTLFANPLELFDA